MDPSKSVRVTCTKCGAVEVAEQKPAMFSREYRHVCTDCVNYEQLCFKPPAPGMFDLPSDKFTRPNFTKYDPLDDDGEGGVAS